MATSPDSSVSKCINKLKGAKTNSEKLNAIVYTINEIKSANLDNPQSLPLIFRAIGYDFFNDILTTTDIPTNCPPYMLKLVTVSLMDSFCNDKELVRDEQLINLTPVLSRVLNDLGDTKDETMIKNEILQCLTCCTAVPENGKRILGSDTLCKLAHAFLNKKADDNAIFQVITKILDNDSCSAAWLDQPSLANQLLENVALKLETPDKIFDTLSEISVLMKSYPEAALKLKKHGKWLGIVRNELRKLMCSKLPPAQRKQLITLSACLIEKLGFHWLLNSNKDHEKLFFMTVNLVCIEVRLIMDGKNLMAIEAGDRDFLCNCFKIIESVIQLLVDDSADLPSLEPQKLLQIHRALQNAACSVSCFLTLSATLFPDQESIKDMIADSPDSFSFLVSTIRVYSVWIAEETDACKEEAAMALPFLLKCAQCEYESKASSALQILLPGLYHLSSETDTRKIILDCDILETLELFMHQRWMMFIQSKDDIIKEQCEGQIIIVLGIFIHVAILEKGYLKSSDLFFQLYKFLSVVLPYMKNNPHHIILAGHLAILGIIIFKDIAGRVESSDSNVFKFLSSVIQFFWDAFNVDESLDGQSLVVSECYRSGWVLYLRELWLLGMGVMTSVVESASWVSEFVIECDWPIDTLVSLRKVRKASGVQREVREAYEGLFCSLIRSKPEFKSVLKVNNAIPCCKRLKLNDLFNLLTTD